MVRLVVEVHGVAEIDMTRRPIAVVVVSIVAACFFWSRLGTLDSAMGRIAWRLAQLMLGYLQENQSPTRVALYSCIQPSETMPVVL